MERRQLGFIHTNFDCRTLKNMRSSSKKESAEILEEL